MPRLLFFLARVHCDLQQHHHVKAVRTPMTQPSKRRLAGRSNQRKNARIAVKIELEAERGQNKVTFYPKFQRELNQIEPYRCKAKWYYTREHCDHSLEGLRQNVPRALASVEQKTTYGGFNRSMRIPGDGL